MKTPRRSLRLALLLFSALAALGPSAVADELWSDSGFFVDLPEGMVMVDGDGASRFAFEDPSGTVTFQILVYEASRHPTIEALRDETTRRLSARGEHVLFEYQRRKAFIADLGFALGGNPMRAYAVGIKGALASGGPGPALGSAAKAPKDILLLAFSEAESFDGAADLMLSCIDAFSIDAEARKAPGPVAQFDRPAAAPGSPTRTLLIGESSVTVPWDAEEAAASQALVEREYRVLTAYSGADPALAEAAWMRFYRIIARDSYRRLERLAFEISRVYGHLEPRERAQALVAWTQGFVYERNPDGADFVSPLLAAFERRGDCDARAMLVLILLAHDNVEGVLLVSAKHEHALAGLDVEGEGARFPWKGRAWLVGETTDEVPLGLIDRTMADPKDWLAVELPFWTTP